MAEFDRLSALIDRFTLRAETTTPDRSNLFVLRPSGKARPTVVVLRSVRGAPDLVPGDAIAVSAHVDWGGADNPLMAALPEEVRFDAAGDDEMLALVGLLCAEDHARRCGSASVLSRLTEILIVKLLRTLLERGEIRGGLLGGLSDPRLSRAIVAMHDAPGRAWNNADMADVAGLSVSRFMDLFRHAVGTTPAAYLRQWRLTLARQDIARGDRVDAVARRYGYGSAEALTHMMRRALGRSPRDLRRAQAELRP